MKDIDNNRFSPPEEAILAEAWIAELLEKEQLAIGDVTIRPVGAFLRGYKPDVLSVDWLEDSDGEQKPVVDVSREGLYDTLPKGLFHHSQPSRPNPFKAKDTMLLESRQLREEEKSARLFFLPIEQEFYRQRLQSEMEERSITPDGFGTLAYWFDILWEEKTVLTERQKSLLFHLLPQAHQLAGRVDRLPDLYAQVIGHPVDIVCKSPPPMVLKDAFLPRLGHGQLGLDTVCGDRFDLQVPGLVVKIGPLSNEAIPDFLPGGIGIRLVERLNQFFLPLEAEAAVEVVSDGRNALFSLGAAVAEARLAYTAIL